MKIKSIEIENFRNIEHISLNFENVNIELGENLYVPSISGINELRRQALAQYEEKLISSFRRLSNANYTENNPNSSHKETKISLLLNTLNLSYDYLELKKFQKINYDISTASCLRQQVNRAAPGQT